MPQPDATDNDAGAACSTSADRILTALYGLYADCEQVPELMIRYALCNLRHLCDQQDLAFAECDRSGHSLYLDELDGSTS